MVLWFGFFPPSFSTYLPVIKSQHHTVITQHQIDTVVDKVNFLPNGLPVINTSEACTSDMQKASLNSGPFHRYLVQPRPQTLR